MKSNLPYIGWVPTPEEIAAECEKIRAEWGPEKLDEQERPKHWEVQEYRDRVIKTAEKTAGEFE